MPRSGDPPKALKSRAMAPSPQHFPSISQGHTWAIPRKGVSVHPKGLARRHYGKPEYDGLMFQSSILLRHPGARRTGKGVMMDAMKVGCILVCLATASPVLAADVRQIELRRLFEPTPAELRAEQAGRIYIYEDLRDTDVARAMEQEFDRIESMMFIRVQRTDDKGEVMTDPESGVPMMISDDGC